MTNADREDLMNKLGSIEYLLERIAKAVEKPPATSVFARSPYDLSRRDKPHADR